MLSRKNVIIAMLLIASVTAAPKNSFLYRISRETIVHETAEQDIAIPAAYNEIAPNRNFACSMWSTLFNLIFAIVDPPVTFTTVTWIWYVMSSIFTAN